MSESFNSLMAEIFQRPIKDYLTAEHGDKRDGKVMFRRWNFYEWVTPEQFEKYEFLLDDANADWEKK